MNDFVVTNRTPRGKGLSARKARELKQAKIRARVQSRRDLANVLRQANRRFRFNPTGLIDGS